MRNCDNLNTTLGIDRPRKIRKLMKLKKKLNWFFGDNKINKF